MSEQRQAPEGMQSNGSGGEEYMSPAETAEYLRVSQDFLKVRRRPGMDGPPFIRLGELKIVYRRSDVDRWASSRMVDPMNSGDDDEL